MSGQFGAARVTNDEVKKVFAELHDRVGGRFGGFELTRTLEEKQDHGDIDVLVLGQNAKGIIESLEPSKFTKNGYVHSFLYKSGSLGREVHIDFLVSGDPESHATKRQYYSFNKLSPAVGVMAKSLNFKYGSEGFFKRYEDKRGNWHDILIDTNLDVGLSCLGLQPNPTVRSLRDIVEYVSGSVLFDSDMYPKDSEDEVFSSLYGLNKPASIEDEDYFFRDLYLGRYLETNLERGRIESRTYASSRYNGTWLMENFGMKAGPEMGEMLRSISSRFGDSLSEVVEGEVSAFVKERLNK